MNVSATVRIRPGTADQDAPDRARLEKAARLLQQSGFDVLRIGRLGISVRGAQGDFARVLGVDAAPNVPLTAVPHAFDPLLHDLIDMVEVTSRPKSY
jgi:hypothetical protein